MTWASAGGMPPPEWVDRPTEVVFVFWSLKRGARCIPELFPDSTGQVLRQLAIALFAEHTIIIGRGSENGSRVTGLVWWSPLDKQQLNANETRADCLQARKEVASRLSCALWHFKKASLSRRVSVRVKGRGRRLLSCLSVQRRRRQGFRCTLPFPTCSRVRGVSRPEPIEDASFAGSIIATPPFVNSASSSLPWPCMYHVKCPSNSI